MIITWSMLPSDWSFVYNLETLYNENIADIVILNQNFQGYSTKNVGFISYERTKYVKIDLKPVFIDNSNIF